jgi:hypothetical protein
MVVCFTKLDKMLARMLFYSLTRFVVDVKRYSWVLVLMINVLKVDW